MQLAPGTKLGPYEIQSAIGAGGMGEVYRARDMRLDRTVAVKILPAHLAEHGDAQERFDREARAISCLSHSNICHLYDVGRQDGINYLVMEYLEGETLADRILKGPLPVQQVLKIGVEICEGLWTAHRSGVLHRDLKPGNVMLTKAGAKLMDFGLAKGLPAASPPSSSLTASFNAGGRSHPLTARGAVVGTFQYMSPEQIEGKETDARSDIFSLGAVLYEMCTGRPAFAGKTTASTIAAILAADPPSIAAIQPMTPPAMDRVVKTCLAKDADARFQSAQDLKLQLKWIAEGGSEAGVLEAVAGQRKNRERLAWTVAAVTALGLLAFGLVHFREAAPEVRVVRSTVLAPTRGTFLYLGAAQTAVLSPDGRQIAFASRTGAVTQLWIRALDSFNPRPLAGTEDVYGWFWSPESRNLGFFTQGKLKRVSAAGGPVLTVCDVDQGRGGSWNQQDVIIFGKYPGEIYRVPASGGTPHQVTKLDATRHDTTHRWPYFLPDGNHFIYMGSPVGSAAEDNVFYVGSLDGKVNRVLSHGSSPVAYGSGYLLYLVDNTLVARPFDVAKLDFTGEAIPIAEGVEFDPIFSNGVFSVSDNGVLLYQTGNATSARTIELFDASGRRVGAMGEATTYFGPRVSPDGKRLAYVLVALKTGKADIWIHDIASGNRTRLTVDPVRSVSPVWSRNGTEVAYYSSRSGKPVIYVKPVNGVGAERKLWEPRIGANPTDWTPDSKAVILQDRNPETGRYRLVLLPADGKADPTPLLEAQNANVSDAQVSADGRWVAYASDESGKYEVYVSPFPKPVGRLQISLAGGRQPRWRHDGKALYYLVPDGSLIAAEIKESNGSPQVIGQRTLFQTKATNTNDSFDVFPDGKKFLVNAVTSEQTATPLSLVLNWTAELKK